MQTNARATEILDKAVAELESAFPGHPSSDDVAGTLGWYQGKRAGIQHALMVLKGVEVMGRLEGAGLFAGAGARAGE